MKRTALVLTAIILIALFSISSYAQEPLIYTEVIQVEGISKDELYQRAKVWFATTYNSANDVLQLDDKEAGQIIGKAVMKYKSKVFTGSGTTNGYINYSIKVYLKDNRYKYELTNFIHNPTDGSYRSFGLITTEVEIESLFKGTPKSWNNKVWKDLKSQINERIPSIISSLKASMQKETTVQADDW